MAMTFSWNPDLLPHWLPDFLPDRYFSVIKEEDGLMLIKLKQTSFSVLECGDYFHFAKMLECQGNHEQVQHSVTLGLSSERTKMRELCQKYSS